MILASAIAVAALLFAACTDVIGRTIPNRAVIVVALAGIASRAGDGVTALLLAMVIAVAIFAGMLLLFQLQIVGGGDVKLLAAASLLSSPPAVPGQMLLIALAGGILALLWIIDRRLRGVTAIPADPYAAATGSFADQRPEAAPAPGTGLRDPALPYGVAICLGTLASMALSS